MNLKTVYPTALGGIPINKKALEFLWPAISSIEQSGYLLDSIIKDSKRPVLSNENLLNYSSFSKQWQMRLNNFRL